MTTTKTTLASKPVKEATTIVKEAPVKAIAPKDMTRVEIESKLAEIRTEIMSGNFSQVALATELKSELESRTPGKVKGSSKMSATEKARKCAENNKEILTEWTKVHNLKLTGLSHKDIGELISKSPSAVNRALKFMTLYLEDSKVKKAIDTGVASIASVANETDKKDRDIKVIYGLCE